VQKSQKSNIRLILFRLSNFHAFLFGEMIHTKLLARGSELLDFAAPMGVFHLSPEERHQFASICLM